MAELSNGHVRTRREIRHQIALLLNMMIQLLFYPLDPPGIPELSPRSPGHVCVYLWPQRWELSDSYGCRNRYLIFFHLYFPLSLSVLPLNPVCESQLNRYLSRASSSKICHLWRFSSTFEDTWPRRIPPNSCVFDYFILPKCKDGTQIGFIVRGR